MPSLFALFWGCVFGAGLAVSGMMNPAKVIGFLDPLGHWDPSLAFVMGGAVVVAAIGFEVAKRRQAPFFAPHFSFPTRSDLDTNLIAGAVLFGVGWGLVGLCPGPAIASLTRGSQEIYLFLGAMAAGVLLHSLFERTSSNHGVDS